MMRAKAQENSEAHGAWQAYALTAAAVTGTAVASARVAEVDAAWYQEHAAALRQLAGTITALPDLPATATDALTALRTALGDSDPARLLSPLAETGPHLRTVHPDLADRVSDIGRHARQMRESEQRQRSSGGP
jgi:hypothetical protein